jgi:hypothetical protein
MEMNGDSPRNGDSGSAPGRPHVPPQCPKCKVPLIASRHYPTAGFEPGHRVTDETPTDIWRCGCGHSEPRSGGGLPARFGLFKHPAYKAQ